MIFFDVMLLVGISTSMHEFYYVPPPTKFNYFGIA